jgi:hypothetical protein
MSFDPLGHFDPNAAANPAIVAKAKALLASLPSVPAGGLTRVYLHWTVGPLGMCFDDYNAEAVFVVGDWALKVTHNPQDNVSGFNDNPEASHTYMRNTGAVGIAITGMDGASTSNFGPDGVTWTGLQHLCAAAAAFCEKYGIDVAGTVASGPFAGEPTILTHAEAADHPGNPEVYAPYGPATTVERWDLDSFVPIPQGTPMPPSSVCGNALRKLIRTYKIALGA